MSLSHRYKEGKKHLRPWTQLLIVSKNQELSAVKEYYQLGHRHFAENRVQDLLERAKNLSADCPHIRWSMIGHLQRNKVKSLLQMTGLHSIHSIDSVKLVGELLKVGSENIVDVFLQFKTSGEQEKFGFTREQEMLEAARLLQNSYFRLRGLMTMGAIRSEDHQLAARECFERLVAIQQKWLKGEQKKLFYREQIQLSMGMSQDYAIAAKLGAHWVRVGTLLFA